jgi:hypothetical protein
VGGSSATPRTAPHGNPGQQNKKSPYDASALRRTGAHIQATPFTGEPPTLLSAAPPAVTLWLEGPYPGLALRKTSHPR